MDPLGYTLYTLNGKECLVNPDVKHPIVCHSHQPSTRMQLLSVFFIGVLVGMLF